MTHVEFLRKLADDYGIVAEWGEYAAICKRLREIAYELETLIHENEILKADKRPFYQELEDYLRGSLE